MSNLNNKISIWVLSDLHLPQKDAMKLVKPDRFPQADICVIPGDVTDSMHIAANWIGKVIRPKIPVVWTPGNHDFYDTSIESGRKNGKMISNAQDVVFLDNSTYVFKNIRFVGSTLWTDFAINTSLETEQRKKDIKNSMFYAKNGLADYSNIYLQAPKNNVIPRLIKPEDLEKLHQESRRYIEDVLNQKFDGKTVVVTHHAPHQNSIHDKYKDDKTNGAFVSDLNDIITKYQPDAWIHGHVHQSFDYYIGKTRIICNPKGYTIENESFVFGKVIEI